MAILIVINHVKYHLKMFLTIISQEQGISLQPDLFFKKTFIIFIFVANLLDWSVNNIHIYIHMFNRLLYNIFTIVI